MKEKYKKIQKGTKKIVTKARKFDSGCKIPVIAAIIISFNIILFVQMFGIDIIDLLNPNGDFEKGNFLRNSKSIAAEKKIKEMTKGYPIQNMARHISKEDEQVAAFLVSIAKKESNWGKRHPKLQGEDCYNYWGFRQKRERMGSGGHTCFDSPKEAVSTVADRIEELIDAGVDTPSDMIVWKCGSSCDGHSDESVSKWISDVDLYYDKFYEK